MHPTDLHLLAGDGFSLPAPERAPGRRREPAAPPYNSGEDHDGPWEAAWIDLGGEG